MMSTVAVPLPGTVTLFADRVGVDQPAGTAGVAAKSTLTVMLLFPSFFKVTVFLTALLRAVIMNWFSAEETATFLEMASKLVPA